MSKSILIIDTPENCSLCDLCHTKDYDYRERIDGEKFCGVENMSVDDYCNYEKQMKPEWCPLKDIPQKTAEENRWFSVEHAQGFNACIDEILKERD